MPAVSPVFDWESSALLYLSLKQGRRGQAAFDPATLVEPTAIQTRTDGTNTFQIFVDAWVHPTFRVGAKLKMFASCSSRDAERPGLGMKVELAHQQALVHTDSRFTVAAYAGKHGWINMDARDPVDWDHVRELVLESYCLNAPKRLAKQVAPGT